ncbi:MAG: hypothetical protein ACFFEF_19625 [Candidatus Thorarchaeota archaeon]
MLQIFIERTFGIDFIYTDLFFCLIWIFVLLREKYKLEFLIGCLGILTNFIIDYFYWYGFLGIRTLEGPINPLLFFIYFSITYGMIEYSYVAVMFRVENNRSRIVWTLFLYSGWLLSGIVSQWIPISDAIIHVAREMSLQRFPMLIGICIGFGFLVFLKYKWKPMFHLGWKRLAYIFLVGILVHMGMETTLAVSGIRPSPLSEVIGEFLFNSLLEFNLGIPILYLIWVFLGNRASIAENDQNSG